MENQQTISSSITKHHQNLISFPLELEELHSDDIEMISLQSMSMSMSMSRSNSSYTSLKDVLLESPPLTPTGSWKEIPIKDPLVQQAAWAYLQPMNQQLWWRRGEDNGNNCCTTQLSAVLVVIKKCLAGHHND